MSKSMQVLPRDCDDTVCIDTYYLARSLTPDILAALLLKPPGQIVPVSRWWSVMLDQFY
jgi:hypothetical protein